MIKSLIKISHSLKIHKIGDLTLSCSSLNISISFSDQKDYQTFPVKKVEIILILLLVKIIIFALNTLLLSFQRNCVGIIQLIQQRQNLLLKLQIQAITLLKVVSLGRGETIDLNSSTLSFFLSLAP
jgi:hypothetical protein